MPINVDFFSDYVEIVRNMFNIDNNIEETDVIVKYAWYELRRIPIKKWKVEYSKELLKNQFYIQNARIVDAIRDKAENGEDLSPHASTMISNIEAKDYMLADWGIYHLHPGHGSRTARDATYVNRSNELLFVYPKNDTLYFIDIMEHGEWANFKIIGIIDKNWPETIEEYKIYNVDKLAVVVNEEELLKLRIAKINANFRIGDSFFVGPGGGIQMDGSSAKAVRMALNVKSLLNDCTRYIRDNENKLRNKIEKKSGKILSNINLDFKLLYYNPRDGNGKLVENNTKIVFIFDFQNNSLQVL